MKALGVALQALGLSLGLGAALFAHPFFALGAWQDAEPATAAAAIGAAICAIGLVLSAGLGSHRAAKALVSPFLLPLAAIGIWGLVAMSWARFPGAALLGAPQTGQGPLWFLGAWAFLASAQVLRAHRRLWRRIVGFALIVCLVMAAGNLPLSNLPVAELGAQAFGWLGPFFRFNDHLAYPGLALLGLALWWRPRRSVMALALFGTALLVLMVARNGTALFAAIAMLVIGFLPAPRILARKWVLIGLILAAHIGPALALRPGIGLQEHPTLASRTVLMRLLEQDWRDQPWKLAVGSGWGQVQEVVSRNLWREDVADAMPGWIDIRRDEFHSHSAAFEALFAGGALTLVLWLAFIGRMPLALRSRRSTVGLACLIGWALLEALWFPMPQGFPFIALMLSAVSGVGSFPVRRWMKHLSMTVLGLLAVGQVAFAMMTVMDGLAWRSGLACLTAPACPEHPQLPRDRRGIESGLAATLVGRWHPDLIAFAGRRAQETGSIVLDAALASRYARRARVTGAIGDADMAVWRAAVERALSMAPWRWPIPAPYADWLAGTARSEELASLLALWRPLAPAEPLVQWFDGVLLVFSDDPADQRRGVELMRMALARDFQHHIEVADDLRAMLEARP